MIAEKRKPQTFKDKVIGGLIGRQMAKPYNKIRKVYGLKPVKAVDEIMSHILNLVPVSKYVVERNLYWEDHHILTGYWFEEEEKFVPDEKLDMFVNAFKKADCRAVIRGCFVIHHCGFGTVAATMIYGIPSIPIPHVLDQMGFAMQLSDINVATKPLQSKNLSETAIYEAIQEMKRTYPEKKKNVALLEPARI